MRRLTRTTNVTAAATSSSPATAVTTKKKTHPPAFACGLGARGPPALGTATAYCPATGLDAVALVTAKGEEGAEVPGAVAGAGPAFHEPKGIATGAMGSIPPVS